MKIAIFTNNYLPNPYGVTASIESFRKQFEKKGHTVFIFAPKYKNYQDENPNVFRYPSLDIKYKIRFPLPVPYSRKLDRKIEKLDIDIIHSQHPNLLGSVAMKWARKKNIPIVFTWHTLYDQYIDYVPFFLRKISARWVIQNAVNYANGVDQIIVPTSSTKKIIEDWGVKNKNIADISTGIEEKFFQYSDKERIQKKLNITADKKIIFSASRLTAEKNVKYLLKEVLTVLKKEKDLVFVFGGGGYLLDDLKKIVADRKMESKVFFPGIIKKSDMKNYFALADIFVYASKSETQGLIISEAMYMGLPVVALKAPGIENLVENNQNGFLVSENEKEFMIAVEKLIKNEELREKFSKKSTEIAREKYTSKVCADKILRVYQDVIKNH